MSRPNALKVIHVHRHTMARNIKTGSRDPVITGRRKHGGAGDIMRSNRIDIVDDDGRVVASVVCLIDSPLKCGARAWIETRLKLVNAERPEEML